MYGFGAIFGKITAIEPLKIPRSINDRAEYLPVNLLCFGIVLGISSPVLPGVVPPLNLTAAYRTLRYARYGQGSSISLPEVMALHRRGSIWAASFALSTGEKTGDFPPVFIQF